MSVPEIVRERLAGEEVGTRVPLGGEDELVVTPTRTLVYRGEGLLSDESVEEYSHEAERIAVSNGRRKSTIRLDHGIDGESELAVPTTSIDDVLPTVFEGVLRAADVAAPDESMRQVYRLGELTIAITDARVIKHVGGDLWDEEYEEYALEDVTGLDVEAGDVSSQIIIEVDGRPQRIKTPSDDAREVREHVERALLDYHDVGSYREFKEQATPVDEPSEAEPTAEADAGRDEAPEAQTTVEESGSSTDSPDGLTFDGADAIGGGATEPTDGSADAAEEIAALREAVERQNELLENHQRTIEQLIEELRRGR